MQFYCRMVSTTVIMLYWFRLLAHKYKKVSKRAQFLHYRCTLRERIEIISISLTMVMVKRHVFKYTLRRMEGFSNFFYLTTTRQKQQHCLASQIKCIIQLQRAKE